MTETSVFLFGLYFVKVIILIRNVKKNQLSQHWVFSYFLYFTNKFLDCHFLELYMGQNTIHLLHDVSVRMHQVDSSSIPFDVVFDSP